MDFVRSLPWWDLLTLCGAILLLAICLVFWGLNLIGLPGNWLVFASATIYALSVPHDCRMAIGWPPIVLLAVLAVFGEIVEFAAGAVGAAKAGSSRRGSVLAIVGSIIGGILGVFVGVPVPIVGPILAAFLFAGLGALIGSVLGEIWAGRDLSKSFHVGHAAFWARLGGTLGKVLLGAVMLAVVMASIILPGL